MVCTLIQIKVMSGVVGGVSVVVRTAVWGLLWKKVSEVDKSYVEDLACDHNHRPLPPFTMKGGVDMGQEGG